MDGNAGDINSRSAGNHKPVTSESIRVSGEPTRKRLKRGVSHVPMHKSAAAFKAWSMSDAGLNTYEIAQRLKCDESWVYNELSKVRERLWNTGLAFSNNNKSPVHGASTSHKE